ncbi:ABC transporter ATP-binding protein [Planctomonas sp. JC2975]|uniref:ABC transporter ATP-binding protein n=1 Tax=Planctomonas sp. JC2975 TaxID=2729626 RepID=UPI001473DD13|nr:ABC transporter ATP-binding protein [Planctomonas sp. JC2975]NNC11595.1 ABC transporter ATP-binding protein [Planctomonas sp. JC2975]
METTSAALHLGGVTKSYGATYAVRGVDLTVERGSTVALLGPNGAGKSTLVGMMVGLVRPDTGTVAVAGLSATEAVASGRIAVMLQDAGLMPGIRVGELVRLAAALYAEPFPADEALAMAGVSEIAKRRVDRLSGGQAQRVRFSLAVVGRPEVLVLDEPTRALDVEGRNAFWAAIRAYAGTGRTVLFSTHYLDEVEGNADRVVMLAAGRVVADGTPHEVRSDAGVSRVRYLLDNEPDADTGDAIDVLGDRELVLSTARRGDRLEVTTADSDELVRRLVGSGLPWHGLEVTPPDLDDSYLRLTGAAAATGSTASTTHQERS